MLFLLEILKCSGAKCIKSGSSQKISCSYANHSSLQLNEQSMPVLFPPDRGLIPNVATYADDVCFLLCKMSLLFISHVSIGAVGLVTQPFQSSTL